MILVPQKQTASLIHNASIRPIYSADVCLQGPVANFQNTGDIADFISPAHQYDLQHSILGRVILFIKYIQINI